MRRLERRWGSSLRSERQLRIKFKFKRKSNCPTQAKRWLEWATRFAWMGHRFAEWGPRLDYDCQNYFTTPAARAMDSSLARRLGCMGSMGRR